jgi:hypothetical protein
MHGTASAKYLLLILCRQDHGEMNPVFSPLKEDDLQHAWMGDEDT